MRSFATRAFGGLLIVMVGLITAFAIDDNRSLAMDSIQNEQDLSLGHSQNLFYMYQPGPDGRLYLGTDGRNWRTLSLPFDGEIRSLAATTPDSAAIYVATAQHLYVTGDGGAEWLPASAELDAPVRLLAPALPAEDMVYAVTEAGTLYKLTDAGRSSMRVTGAGLPTTVRALVTDPLNPQKLYAATDDGVWISHTVGEQWEQIPALPAANNLHFNVADPRILYVTTLRNGIFVSTDGGGTWQPINEGLVSTPETAPAVTALVQSPTEAGLLYVALVDLQTGTADSIFVSEDGGAQWLPLAEVEEAVSPIDTLLPEPAPGVGVRAETPTGVTTYRMDSDAALDQLQSQDPDAQLRGIKTLSLAAVPTQVDLILPYIHSADGQIGYYAARALGRIGGDAVTREMVRLVEEDAEGIVAHRALLALQLIGDPNTLPTLERAFYADALARSAADALAAVGTREAWAILVGTLEAAPESAQRQAAMALFETRSTEATPYLLAQLSHADPHVRANVAEALAWSKDKAALAPLRTLLQDGDALVRERAAFALGIHGDTEAIESLSILSVSDPDPAVRQAASQALVAVQSAPGPVAPADMAALELAQPEQGLNWTRLAQGIVLVISVALALLVMKGTQLPFRRTTAAA